jgi:hypothetical protein
VKAGIVIETWKQSIFEKRLKDAGYAFTTSQGIMMGTLSIYVIIEDGQAGEPEKLAGIVRAANDYAARSKLH